MNESIIVSLNKDGDTVTITTEPGSSGLLLPKDGVLQMLSLFIGKRDVFVRRHQAPEPVDLVHDWAINWTSEMARHFGVPFSALEPEAADCRECGRLVEAPGLCPHCADKRSGFSRI